MGSGFEPQAPHSPDLVRLHPALDSEASQDRGPGRASGASLSDQPFGLPLDHESCRGFKRRLSEGWQAPSAEPNVVCVTVEEKLRLIDGDQFFDCGDDDTAEVVTGQCRVA